MGDDGKPQKPEPAIGAMPGENIVPIGVTLSFEEFWKAAPDALPADLTRFIDQLVEHSSDNPGLPFEPWIVTRLVKLRQRDRAAYERLLPRLKSARVRSGELDKLVTRQSGEDLVTDSLPGQPLTWAEDEPWLDQVNGAALLDAIVAALRKHIVVSDDQAHAIALWTVAAHALDCFDIFPRLALWSPVKRCGKTTTLEFLSYVAPRTLATSNISAAAIFRTIDNAHPTMLIDETETFADANEEIRGILNSGHTRTAAYVVRTVGDDHTPRKFSTWCPMAVALIGRLWPTLADRSIEIALRRRSKAEQVERLRSNRVEHLVRLRRMAASWIDDHAAKLTAWDGEVPGAAHDRAADNWRPLLAVADCAGGEWRKRARAAVRVVSGVADTDDVAVELLADIRALFDAEKPSDKLPTKAILEGLHAMEERPWKEWGKRSNPITDRQMAKLLKRFEIISKTIRDDPNNPKSTPKGYERTAFEDAWQRYLPAENPADSSSFPPIPPLPAATAPQPAPHKGFCDFSHPTQKSAVSDENAQKPVEIQDTWRCGGSENQGHVDSEHVSGQDDPFADLEPETDQPKTNGPVDLEAPPIFVPFKFTERLPASSNRRTPCALCGEASASICAYANPKNSSIYWLHDECRDHLARHHKIALDRIPPATPYRRPPPQNGGSA